jgi:hypothetical protein
MMAVKIPVTIEVDEGGAIFQVGDGIFTVPPRYAGIDENYEGDVIFFWDAIRKTISLIMMDGTKAILETPDCFIEGSDPSNISFLN